MHSDRLLAGWRWPCGGPKVTNVTINIASVKSFFGLGTFAGPVEAHTGYDTDERVGGPMAN